MPRVAYLGPEGSFSEEAVRAHFGGDAEAVMFPDIAAAISALSHRLVQAAVVPIENSIEGSVNVTLDQLIHGTRPPRISAELNLPIRHHLVARPGTALSDIERLVAHPQAFAQCQQYIHEHLPQVQVLPALSNSAAVQSLVHSSRIAAIGNRRAAELYGMEILVSDIQDGDDNVTRFVVLGFDPVASTGRDKTSICCSIAEDRPGSLVAILREFSDRGINLTKIESRPTRGGLGKYFFLIDMVGHESDPDIAAALAGVSENSHVMTILGSYPAAIS
jgi:prephenate dehydratase